MQIHFGPTKETFKNVLKLDRTTKPVKRFRWILLMWIAPAAAIISLVNSYFVHVVLARRAQVISAPGATTSEIMVFVICSMGPLLVLFSENGTYRNYMTSISPCLINGEIHLSISEEGIEVLREGENATAKLSWNDFGYIVRNENVVILYSKDKKSFQYFPKNAFSPQGFAEFLEIAASHTTGV